jgi:predicted RNA-binding protein associated with RNAse of E/G family
MEKKQTAVQWLLQQIENNLAIGYDSITKQQYEQALQMEREQIEEAHQNGFYCGNDIAHSIKPEYNSSKDYYTQTFKP